MNKTNLYDNMVGLAEYKTTDKITNILNIRNMLLNKTLTMFNYKGLPDSIPYIEIEKILQLNGYGFITMYENNLVVLNGTYHGVEKDIYNNPLKIRCFIPNKNEYEVFNIADGILIRNDYLEKGIKYIIDKFAFLINESEITLTIANKWKRSGNIFIANDDSTAESVRTYLNKLKQGEDSFIVSNLLYDSIKVMSENNNRNTTSELIEYDNYIRSLLYSEIGLFSNSNMKKERLITSEIENADFIYPLVDNMLDNRLDFISKLNDKYNLEVEVSFSSSWEYREKGETATEQDLEENEKGENEIDE